MSSVNDASAPAQADIRFQSFPDNFRFTGSKIEVARQIGNAVPPLLAKALADQVACMWREQVVSDETREHVVI
ncbi:MAG: DNA cytosine methyltransferase [Opitutales bacterium]